jgi:hypothetical protein
MAPGARAGRAWKERLELGLSRVHSGVEVLGEPVGAIDVVCRS